MASRQDGRKFEKWVFKPGEENLDVECRVMVDERRSLDSGEANPYRGKTVFFVNLPDWEINERDIDVNALKTRVFEMMSSCARIPWESKLYVRVHTEGMSKRHWGSYEYDLNQISIKLDVDAVEVGKRRNGEFIYRNQSKEKDESRIHSGLLKTGYEADHHNSGGKMRALIDDTPANRKALSDIDATIVKIGERLQELLSPETLAQTLIDFSTRKQLSTTLAEMPVVEVDVRTVKEGKKK